MTDSKVVVLDASVVLNLLGTSRPRFVLESTTLVAMITPTVAREIIREPALPTSTDSTFAELLDSGHLRICEVEEEAEDLALTVSGAAHPNDLDDGEASAIAYAAYFGSSIGVDERKARRVVGLRWPKMRQYYSIELLYRAAEAAAISEAEFAEIMFSALRHARMRVPSEYQLRVRALLGIDRAAQCLSLGQIR